VSVLGGCSDEKARLSVELSGPPVRAAFWAHGNCFAGWYLRVRIRVRETSGTPVMLESLSWRIEDVRDHTILGENTVDPVTLRHDPAAMLGAHGTYEQGAAVPVSEDFRGRVVVAGEVAGKDVEGGRVHESYYLNTPETIVNAEPRPPGGICSGG
jgi:hypothetical protein